MNRQDHDNASQDSFLERVAGGRLLLFVLPAAFAALYLATYVPTEPFFNNDETRHVMTGVYFRDVFRDMPFTDLGGYTVNYYLQYPALGLLVWPPFFYFLEGVLMSVFGTSLVVPKTLVVLFAALACVYLFRLVRRTHDARRAALAVLVFGLSPLVFEYAHYVMQEVPTLALSLASVFHFTRYLDDARRRELVLAGLFAALAALTRFDAVHLIPLFVILLLARGRLFAVLRRREVWVVALLAALVVAPFYVMSAAGIGWAHLKFATETLPNVPGFFSLRRVLFYPSFLPSQIGWFALVAAIVGLVAVLSDTARRAASWPYLATIVATYLTFTPMGEIESRHTIYWVPALALFAVEGLKFIAGKLRAPTKLYAPLAALVLAGTAWTAFSKPLTYVRGYEEAARHVAANSSASPFCLFVGRLNGDFVYQLRRLDPQRKLWVLRADKILFSVLIVPGGDSRQFATNEGEMLDTVFKYDPEFIVVEQPATLVLDTPDERLRSGYEEGFRGALTNHPERFKLEKEIALDSNHHLYRGMRLLVYRNTLRNPNPERRLSMEVLMLRRSLGADVP